MSGSYIWPNNRGVFNRDVAWIPTSRRLRRPSPPPPPSGDPAPCLPWIGIGWVAGCMEQQYTLGWICCDQQVTEPEVIHPMGSDPRTAALRARIRREDDEILAIIMAFMEIKD